MLLYHQFYSTIYIPLASILIDRRRSNGFNGPAHIRDRTCRLARTGFYADDTGSGKRSLHEVAVMPHANEKFTHDRMWTSRVMAITQIATIITCTNNGITPPLSAAAQSVVDKGSYSTVHSV